MKPKDLDPGMYLVGRDDGAVEPFFVKMLDCGAHAEYHAEVTALFERAQKEKGWWWQREDVPGRMPSQEDIDALPPFPKERE